jgi:hypothetical protein
MKLLEFVTNHRQEALPTRMRTYTILSINESSKPACHCSGCQCLCRQCMQEATIQLYTAWQHVQQPPACIACTSTGSHCVVPNCILQPATFQGRCTAHHCEVQIETQSSKACKAVYTMCTILLLAIASIQPDPNEAQQMLLPKPGLHYQAAQHSLTAHRPCPEWRVKALQDDEDEHPDQQPSSTPQHHPSHAESNPYDIVNANTVINCQNGRFYSHQAFAASWN